MIHHEMYKDLGSLLNKELTDAGYKTNPDYPSPLADQPNADDPTKRDYYYAWNIAYQFGNIIHRMIRPAQRRIYWSKNLLNKYKGGLITPAQMNAINSITADSAAGLNLVRFMSFQIEKADFEDKMYYDWRIAHLHLDSTLSTKPHLQTNLVHFTERTGPILFVFHKDNGLYLLDIMPHGVAKPKVWGEKELVEILHRDWPDIIAGYRMTGFTKVHYNVESADEILALRKAGVIYPITTFDGTIYRSFGGGLNSAGGSTTVVQWADTLFINCRNYLLLVEKHAQEIIDNIEKLSGERPRELDLTLALNQQNQPVFIDKATGVALLTSSTSELPTGAVAVRVNPIPTGRIDPGGEGFPLRLPA